MSTGRDVLVIVGGYALGCVSPGYWLVRWRTGEDVRRRHSGSTGARNVGRVLGRGGFALTCALDAAKGALAVGLGGSIGGAGWAVAGAAVAVVVGHVWPAPLGFRGGRGLVTALGATLVLHPPTALALLGLDALLGLATRRAVAAALGAVAAAPLLAALLGAGASRLAAIAGMAAVTLFAHRAQIRGLLGGVAAPAPGRSVGPPAGREPSEPPGSAAGNRSGAPR